MDRATYDKTIVMGEERLWNRNYCKVMTANFTLFFAFYLLTPLLPLYLSETFGATKDMIGLVLSGYTITALLFRPFSGYMVDSAIWQPQRCCCLPLSERCMADLLVP